MKTDVTTRTLDGLPDEARSLLLDLRCELAALRVYLALQRLVLSHKAGFNPAQLRIPAGQPGGGQWTDGEGGDGGDVILVGARGRGSVAVRIGNQTFEATPAQAARYAVANARAEAAAARVAQVDPTWRPQRSLTDPNSIEGQIRRAEGEAREAEARLAELARGRFGDNQGRASILPVREPAQARHRSRRPRRSAASARSRACLTWAQVSPALDPMGRSPTRRSTDKPSSA